jgi:hypothetical protein
MGKSELAIYGFSYTITLKNKKGKVFKDFRIYYHDLEIYRHIIHINIDADVLFINICNEYKNNFIK